MIFCLFFFFQAEDGIRDAQESRGLGDVYKRQDDHRDIKQRKNRKKISKILSLKTSSLGTTIQKSWTYLSNAA